LAKKKEPQIEEVEVEAQESQVEFGYPDEDDEGLYGWKFHKAPLLVAIVLTVIFYIFVFLWVD